VVRTSGAGWTVRVTVRETVPNVAEIVDEPAETAVAKPEALIVARAGAEEAHVT
jgi:hypothetical protein